MKMIFFHFKYMYAESILMHQQYVSLFYWHYSVHKKIIKEINEQVFSITWYSTILLMKVAMTTHLPYKNRTTLSLKTLRHAQHTMNV